MARDDPPYDPLAWSVRGKGKFVARDDNHDLQRALARFRAKCGFCPRTGCVIWTGGKTRGRGNSATYGSFWYNGRRWFAHRWAARFIHGLEIDGLTVGHNCPHTVDGHPDTLCVQHLSGETLAENIAEGNTRRALPRAQQPPEERKLWLLTELGYLEPPPTTDRELPHPVAPDFTPPEWLGLLRED